ncbi:hypothetical protein [Halonatronum saccharophilum]|uniref:hypothetical protein n=1 Tax=Halonatronum saccharophilum TaxID=150060 RepID=UPI000489D330|nr:hypothetical protein [Halonatronum saccharophilum]
MKDNKILKFIFKNYDLIVIIFTAVIYIILSISLQLHIIENTSLELNHLIDPFWVLDEKLGSLLTFLIAVILVIGCVYTIFKLGVSLRKDKGPERRIFDMLKYGFKFMIKFSIILISVDITRAGLKYIAFWLGSIIRVYR